MVLSGFQSVSLTLFGWLGRFLARDSYQLKIDLVKARIPLLPDGYVAISAMQVLLTFLGGVALTAAFIGIGVPFLEQQTTADGEPFSISGTVQWGLGLLLVIILPLLIALVQWLTPGFTISQRTHDMDRKLPFAGSYVAAMAAANATPSVIFKSLARNEFIYGEISRDAAWIYHSIEFMGRDLVTTLKEAVERSPSERFAEFLQGIVGTLTSGGNLKLYFLNRSEYYAQANRVHVKSVIQQMALFAEAYVVMAVALPIFAMIIAVITFWVSGSGMVLEEVHLYGMVFVMFPMIQLFFCYIFLSLSNEVAVD